MKKNLVKKSFDTKMVRAVTKKTVDGILNVVVKIADQNDISTVHGIYDFILAMCPDEFADIQIQKDPAVIDAEYEPIENYLPLDEDPDQPVYVPTNSDFLEDSDDESFEV